MKLILASKSPRRREILTMLGLHPEILSLETDETFDRTAVTPDELVMGLACRKVRAAYEFCRTDPEKQDALFLAADTVVSLHGTVLEKPKDAEDAKRMLHSLSGCRHEVYTGVSAVYGGKLAVDVQCTHVCFRPLSDEEIDAYVATGEPMDKAGAYGIQLRGCLFAERIEGEYFNVVGLPVVKIDAMLKEAYGFGLTGCIL